MKPILFNTDIVRAILAGKKTMTRRVVKLKYSNTHLEMFTNKYGTRLIEKQNEEPGITTIQNPDGTTTHTLLACIEKTPPYRPGDILYVRETWTSLVGSYIYKADQKPGMKNPGKWNPSIHMPREAARIFLRVTGVRVERLQDMTEADAVAEGFEAILCDHPGGYPCTDCMNTGYLEPAMLGFVETWDSTIKPSDRALYGWDANPWVWVIAFERISREEALYAD